jgi:hypothetical protein
MFMEGSSEGLVSEVGPAKMRLAVTAAVEMMLKTMVDLPSLLVEARVESRELQVNA